MESVTELGRDDTGSDEDMINSDVEADLSDSVASLLEYRLQSTLGHDPELASRLIPRIIAQLLPEIIPEDVENISTMANESPGTAGGSEITDSALSTPANANSGNDMRPRKRGWKRDQSEERRGNGSSRQRDRLLDRSPEGLRFACHFYKRDPTRCLPRDNIKYRVCAGPGFLRLQHLK